MRSAASLLALVLALSLGACGGAEARETTSAATPRGASFTNPVYDENFPDPFVLRVGETYYAYGTNGDNGNVPTLVSRDLVHWRQGKDAMPELAAWVTAGRTWAPEVLARGDGRYVLYYTAQSLDLSAQCLGRAVSSSPQGPFVDRSRRPFVCQKAEGGSIDASPFTDRGRLYLLWKNDGNCCGKDTFIYAQRLTPDGLGLAGQRVRLVTQDARWEGTLVEAPTLWKERGRYYLFYSANAYDSDAYAVGYARCATPLGPCKDGAENPILKTWCNAFGPGHQAVLRDDDGETWLVYHAWPPDAVGSEYPGRLLWLDRLVWRDGKPDVRGPTCGAQPIP